MRTYILPASILNNSPSLQDGISAEIETNNRIFACELIGQAGRLLRLPQATISTAQILLHRFYYRVSMRRHPIVGVVMACTLLATNVEESPRSVRDIITTYHRVLQKRSVGTGRTNQLTIIDPSSRKFKRWSDLLIGLEVLILKELGFILYVDHPHNFFFHYVNALSAGQEIAQRAWNFLNDAMRTNICLRFKPENIATAAIYLAARVLQVKLPENPPWYELFDTDKKLCEEVCAVIADLYTRPKARYLPIDDADATSNSDVCGATASGNTESRWGVAPTAAAATALPRSESSAVPLSTLASATTTANASGLASTATASATATAPTGNAVAASDVKHAPTPLPRGSTGAATASTARSRSRSRSRSPNHRRSSHHSSSSSSSSSRRRSRSRSRSRSKDRRSSHHSSRHKRSSQEKDKPKL